MLEIFQFFRDVFFVTGYLSHSRSFPKPLPPEREKEVIEAYLQGDEKARDLLIEHNLRLVAHIAKKYAGSGVETDDLISIGTIGLIKGVNTFNRERGSSLTTYAARCVENEVLMYLRSMKKRSGEISLAEPIGEDTEGNKISLADILGTEDSDVGKLVETRIQVEKLQGILTKTLTPREKVVIELRYGLGGQEILPQREIAKRLGISRSYISRIEKKALQKLSRAMEL